MFVSVEWLHHTTGLEIRGVFWCDWWMQWRKPCTPGNGLSEKLPWNGRKPPAYRIMQWVHLQNYIPFPYICVYYWLPDQIRPPYLITCTVPISMKIRGIVQKHGYYRLERCTSHYLVKKWNNSIVSFCKYFNLKVGVIRQVYLGRQQVGHLYQNQVTVVVTFLTAVLQL